MVRNGIATGSLKPSIPLIELGTPSCSLSGDSAFDPLTWSDIYFCTSDFEYRSNGDILVYTTGIYRVEFEMTVNYSGSGVGNVLCQTLIYKNNTFIDNAVTVKTLQTPNPGNFTANPITVSKTLFLNAYDTVTMMFYTDDSAHTTFQYGRCRITYIPSSGWNNNSGGSVINRGIRR